MILNNRIIRQFKQDLLRNLMLMLLIIVGLSVVLGGALGNMYILETNEKYQKINNLESGSFTVSVKLTSEEEEKIKENGTQLEEEFYVDLKTDNSKTLRIFSLRENINKIQVESGSAPKSDSEIALEKHFAEANAYSVGGNITVNGKVYSITAICSSPDYNYVKKNASDLTSKTSDFSTAFVTKDAFESLSETPVYNYAYVLGDTVSNKDIKNKLSDIGTMTAILISETNSRVNAYEDDCGLMKNASLISGFVFMILAAYIITVFLASIIEREETVIGTLYSLGYLKGELIWHYMILPLMMVFVSSVISIFIAVFCTSNLLASDSVALYSMPELEVTIDPIIIIYGIAMPIAVTILVNLISLNKNLSRKPIDLIRKHRSSGRNIGGKLKNARFMTAFRIRQFFSELGGNIVLIIGILISSVLLVLGFTIEAGMDNYVSHVTDDVSYNYQYTLKMPPFEVPEGAEAVLDKTFVFDNSGTNTDIIMEGIGKNSKFFSFTTKETAEEIIISDAFANKCGISKGDKITLTDKLNDKNYEFTVSEIVPYNYGLCVFMNFDSMHKAFDIADGYYNSLVSDEKLDIDDEFVISVTTDKEIIEAAEALTQNMQMMMFIMDGLGLVVFAIVIFLLVRMMIEKSSFSVSLIKIFGYKQGEISKIYLGTTFFVTLIGCIVSLPISMAIIDKLYPFLTKNLPAYIVGTLDAEMYIYLISYMLVVYIIVNIFLNAQLKRISLAQVIKNRE